MGHLFININKRLDTRFQKCIDDNPDSFFENFKKEIIQYYKRLCTNHNHDRAKIEICLLISDNYGLNFYDQ